MNGVKFYTKLDDELRNRILKTLKEAEEWYNYLLTEVSLDESCNTLLMGKDLDEVSDLIKELKNGKKEDAVNCKWGECVCPLDVQEAKALADLERNIR